MQSGSHFTASLDLLAKCSAEPEFLNAVDAIAARLSAVLQDGRRIYLCGNGGSAADAQHVAAEFLSRFAFDREPLPAIALTTDSSVLTAIGNDYGFEQVFARQVRGLARPGDALIAISTSGTSPNVLAAIAAAADMDVTTIGFCGARAALPCDLCLAVPSESTALIQQIHLVAFHAICGAVEREIYG